MGSASCILCGAWLARDCTRLPICFLLGRHGKDGGCQSVFSRKTLLETKKRNRYHQPHTHDNVPTPPDLRFDEVKKADGAVQKIYGKVVYAF